MRHVLSLILRCEVSGLLKSPAITSIPGLDESHFYKQKEIYPSDFQIASEVIRTKYLVTSVISLCVICIFGLWIISVWLYVPKPILKKEIRLLILKAAWHQSELGSKIWLDSLSAPWLQGSVRQPCCCKNLLLLILHWKSSPKYAIHSAMKFTNVFICCCD